MTERPILSGDAAGQRVAVSGQQLSRHDAELISGGVDEPYVNDPEAPPETMTHQDIWNSAQELDRAQSALWNACVSWANSSISVTGLFQLTRIGIHNVMQDRWVGAAGQAALEATRAFTQSGERMGDVGKSVAMRLDQIYYATQAFVAAVPEPVHPAPPDPDNPDESVLPGLTNGAKDRADFQAAARARDQAIAAVRTTYLPAVPTSGNDVPAFAPPPETGAEAPVITSPAASSTQSTSNEEQGAVADRGPEDGSSNDNGPPSDTQAAATTSTASTAQSAMSTSQTTAPASTGSGANPSATAGQPTGTPLTSTGAPAGDQNARTEVRGAGGGSATTPGPHRPVPGSTPGIGRVGGQPTALRPTSPTLGTPATSAGASASKTTASGAGRPVGPMAPGNARRNDDTERTSGVPDYLKRQQPDLLDHRTVVSPVVGADDQPTPTTTTNIQAAPPLVTPRNALRNLFSEPVTTPAHDNSPPDNRTPAAQIDQAARHQESVSPTGGERDTSPAEGNHPNTGGVEQIRPAARTHGAPEQNPPATDRPSVGVDTGTSTPSEAEPAAFTFSGAGPWGASPGGTGPRPDDAPEGNR